MYIDHITYVNIFLENIHNINIIIMTRRIQGPKIEPYVEKGIYCQKMFCLDSKIARQAYTCISIDIYSVRLKLPCKKIHFIFF